ncbi:MAG: hypothetical protein COV45_05280 [Deltaproteobacteria bacterium CG11_big_fil_rev_8_21_14_0_20_47_16]|nr:MAG: hypothetical protein COV45_05280 [Deltaproteobacteria bacterium CG11_big_fil_rev_8_21_14_0_20_47_16]
MSGGSQLVNLSKNWGMQVLLLACLTVLIIFANGYLYDSSGTIANTLTLHATKSNPLMLQQDPFVFFLMKVEGFIGVLNQLLLGLAGIFGHFRWIVFVTFILVYFCIFATLYRLTANLAGPRAGLIACALILIGKPILGIGGMPYFELSARLLVMPLQILACNWFFQSKYKRSAIVLGLSCNFHLMHTAFLIPMIVLAYLMSHGWGWRQIKRIALYSLLGLLFALPTILSFLIPLLQSEATSRHGWGFVGPDDAWLQIMLRRNEHASFPFSWSILRWSHFFSYLAILGCAAAIFRSWAPTAWKNASMLRRKAMGFLVGILLWCALGVVLTEFWPNVIAIQGSFFRSTLYLALMAIVVASALFDFVWQKNRAGWQFFVWVMLTLLLVMVRIKSAAMMQILWSVGGTLVVLDYIKMPLPHINRRICFWGALLVSLFFAAMCWKLNYSDAQTMADKLKFDFLQVGLILSTMVWSYLLVQRAKVKNPFFVAAVGLVVLFSTVEPAMFYEFPWHPAGPWIDVQLAAARLTPKEAVLITPPYQLGFRMYSQRTIVGEIQDGCILPLSREFTLLWQPRMTDLGVENRRDIPALVKYYRELSEKDVLRLAKKYNASFIVVESDKALNFKQLYKNDTYVLYALPTPKVKNGSNG